MYKFCSAIICFLSFALSSCNNNSNKVAQASMEMIGEQFTLANIDDDRGRMVKIDYSKSDITIIDFWIESCAPCIEEMKQFPALLKGKEGQVSVYSISVNQYWLWKKTLSDVKFAFLSSEVPNWKHLTLRSVFPSSFKNKFSGDRLAELEDLYGIKGFPAYFVLDNAGKIIERPESAVAYLKSL